MRMDGTLLEEGRQVDAAHAGEAILDAKGGRPWARLVPLEKLQAQAGGP
jgi:antitoxin (DNA-binding transcriptional repressor) of toxin-antitoxin stability system